MKDIVLELEYSLIHENTDARRKAWVQQILNENLPIKEFLGLLDSNPKVAMRFMWLIGDICEHAAHILIDVVPHFYSRKDTMQFPNYDRSLAKIFYYVGIPEDLEGEVIDELFSYILDPERIVSTKHYAALALFKACSKHMDLRHELKEVLTIQMGKNKISFDKLAARLIKELEKADV